MQLSNFDMHFEGTKQSSLVNVPVCWAINSRLLICSLKYIDNDDGHSLNTHYDIENSLKNRRKGQFLTENQSLWIHQEATSKRKTEDEIVSSYYISPSTLRRILKCTSNQKRDYDKLQIKSYSEWWSFGVFIKCIELYL